MQNKHSRGCAKCLIDGVEILNVFNLERMKSAAGLLLDPNTMSIYLSCSQWHPKCQKKKAANKRNHGITMKS
ncbi:Ubiquitin thioesterase OTU1 [Psidium guajava]|nr:Ubiquitin thioesterase OTU1 [Psidium guajava]